jgi:hypothetical protein
MGPCNVKPELSCQYGHLDCGTPISSGRLAYSRCVDGEWRLAATPGSCPPPGGSGGAGNGGGAGKGSMGKGGTMQQGSVTAPACAARADTAVDPAPTRYSCEPSRSSAR